MSKTAAIPMDKEIQSFQFIFTGQQQFYFQFHAFNGRTKKEEHPLGYSSLISE